MEQKSKDLNGIQPVLSEEELRLLLSADQVQAGGTGEEVAADQLRPLGNEGSLPDQVAQLQGQVSELTERLERQEHLVRLLSGVLERVEGLEIRLASVAEREQMARAGAEAASHRQQDGNGQEVSNSVEAKSATAETLPSPELAGSRPLPKEVDAENTANRTTPAASTPSRLATYGRRKRRL